MTILDTKIPTDGLEAIEAAPSRYFFAPKPGPQLELDLAGIQPLRREVLLFARRLAQEKLEHSVLKSCVEVAFHEAIGELQTALSIDSGALRLKIGRKPLAPSQATGALIGDYSSGKPDTIDISADKITALKVLPFPSTPDDYRPVVDMRVRTSIDPETVPDFPPTEPLGSWFRFSLSYTDMVQLVPSGPED